MVDALTLALMKKIAKEYGGISGAIDDETIKTAVNDYIDANGLQIDETDPTVSDWAKQSQKPSYTYTEISDAPEELTNMDIEAMINNMGGLL